MTKKDWKVWDANIEYGDVFYKRATGSLPEMESSKAAAKHVKKILQSGDKLIDIGCGAGHYLKSLVNTIVIPFNYLGVDATDYYVKLGNKAWSSQIEDTSCLETADFKQGDIFNIPVQANEADVVMCNNVLLHLPSVEKPINELIRISKKYIIIRMLLGENTFRIKQSYAPEVYDENGEPENFNFHNIYSEKYISDLLKNNDSVASFRFINDTDFSGENINASIGDYKTEPTNVTKVINGMQVNNYIIQPWQFVIIEKK